MFFIKGGWCGKLVGALNCESQGGKRGGESKIQTKTNSRNKKNMTVFPMRLLCFNFLLRKEREEET